MSHIRKFRNSVNEVYKNTVEKAIKKYEDREIYQVYLNVFLSSCYEIHQMELRGWELLNMESTLKGKLAYTFQYKENY